MSYALAGEQHGITWQCGRETLNLYEFTDNTVNTVNKCINLLKSTAVG